MELRETPKEPDEWDLWQRSCDGDAEAKEALFARVLEVAHAALLDRGATSDEADDLAQQTALGVLSCLERRMEVGHLRGFLKFRAWGVLSDHRKTGRRRPQLVAVEKVPEPATRTDHGDTTDAEEFRLALHVCCEEIRPEEQEVFHQRYIEGLSNREIAMRNGLPSSTVGVRLFRGLAGIRRCLERKGYRPGGLL